MLPGPDGIPFPFPSRLGKPFFSDYSSPGFGRGFFSALGDLTLSNKKLRSSTVASRFKRLNFFIPIVGCKAKLPNCFALHRAQRLHTVLGPRFPGPPLAS